MPGASIEVRWTWSSFTCISHFPCQNSQNPKNEEYPGFQLGYFKPFGRTQNP